MCNLLDTKKHFFLFFTFLYFFLLSQMRPCVAKRNVRGDRQNKSISIFCNFFYILFEGEDGPVMILSRNMLKRVGESRHSCRTPTVVRNKSPMLLLKRTALVALS